MADQKKKEKNSSLKKRVERDLIQTTSVLKPSATSQGRRQQDSKLDQRVSMAGKDL
jgi:hypothetical protein